MERVSIGALGRRLFKTRCRPRWNIFPRRMSNQLGFFSCLEWEAERQLGEAPPDVYNQKGQNWGLAPYNPLSLHGQAYRPFIELLRANMRRAGAVRLDHV